MARAAPPPQPAALRQPGARAPPSASRRPRCLLPPPPSLLAPSPRAGSALTPPHAAAAAGRWRGTTAALCWMKSSPPSSSTISPTHRYGRPGPQAWGQGAELLGLQSQPRRPGRSGGRPGKIGGSRLQSRLSMRLAMRSVTGARGWRSPVCVGALGTHSGWEGFGLGHLESSTPCGQAEGYRVSPGRLSRDTVREPLRLMRGAVGAPLAPGTCCRTFTWTCGPGTGACLHPRSLLALQPLAPQVLLSVPLSSPPAPAARSFLSVAR